MHKNISGKKVSSWKDGYRNFENEVEMSKHIVKEWNKCVAEDDILWCLGDWAFQGIDNIWGFRKQLRCKEIHLILGNHDHHIEKNKQYTIKEGNEERHTNIQDMFSSVQHYKELDIGGRKFFLLHYAMRIWLGSHKGNYHLYGHSHSSLEDSPNGKSMDVGIDNAYKILKQYRPFHIDEVIKILDKREIAFNDHHTSETNSR
jgi:calcineurin-like phosphoesterase family protein